MERIRCPRVKEDGTVCGGWMEVHGFKKETREYRYVCKECGHDERLHYEEDANET